MRIYSFCSLMLFSCSTLAADDRWIEFEGTDGPGKGKHIVLISGDEEYRSEEALPQLAKILAKHHGFQCTVLFAIDPTTARSTRTQHDNIPGLEALDTADLLILFTRFRDLPDEQMKHIVDYVESGKPIIGLRTATHAFNIKTEQDLRQVHLARRQGVGRRLRPAGAGRDLDQPPRPARQAEHARASSPRAGGHPILRGHQGRRHLGADRRLRRAAAAAGRQPAAGAGPGARRHEADRPARRRARRTTR